MRAINAADRPVHPEDPRIAGCAHVVFTAPGRDGADAARPPSIHPAGWTARRAGPGRRARLAQLHARGELAVGTPFVHESVIGTRFTGRVVAETTEVGGRPAVVPEITGRAWITGMGQYLLDADDPFPAGFASCEPRRRRGRRRDRRRRGRARARRPRRRRALLDRGEVSSGTTGLGEGNVLARRQGRRARARAHAARAWRCTTSSRSGWAGRRGSAARAR